MFPRAFLLVLTLATAPAADASSRVEVAASSPAPGERGTLSFTVLERADRDLPLLVSLSAPAGLTLLDNRLTWAHVVDAKAVLPRLEARFRAPNAPGEFQVTATVRYYVCGELNCRLRDVPVKIAVRVAAL